MVPQRTILRESEEPKIKGTINQGINTTKITRNQKAMKIKNGESEVNFYPKKKKTKSKNSWTI